ncbi:MAG: hypothetical protein CMJ49_13780 [Planctomycetaceae bacterium]|nr:hypothetical protein [Planctomycetaceae bacterium]
MPNPRTFQFQRFGSSYHLVIQSADDLQSVLELDDAHWIATSAPVDGLRCDPVFLSYIEERIDGRIICDELRDAIRWALDMFRDRSGLERHDTVVQLEAINPDAPDGHRALEAARKILLRNGTDDHATVSLAQVRAIKQEVEDRPVSEACVVLPDAADDPDIRQCLTDIVATLGGSPHPAGTNGVSLDNLDQFLTQARAYLDWHARGQIPDGAANTDVQPLGAQTAAAYAALLAVRDKIDQFFAHCRAVAHDPALAARFAPKPDELNALDPRDPASIDAVLRSAPLAPAVAERTLDLTTHINPADIDALAAFKDQVLQPALEQSLTHLTEAQWLQVKQYFAAHDAWAAAPAGAAVARLGIEKLNQYLEPRFAEAVRQLETAGHATAFDLENVRLLEKLILFQAHLIPVAANFVSFPELYDTSRRAMFEMGTLVMDGRRFNLAVRVSNRAEHAKIAAASSMYVMYLQVSPADGAAKYEVAVPVTSGTKGNLAPGKRGVFNDLKSHLCDARVIQIIDNPVSLGEAIIAPFQRIARVLTGKIEAMTTSAEKKLDTATSSAFGQVESAVAQPAATTPPPAQAPPQQSRAAMTGGLLMGGGVAVAALGSSVAYITKTLSGLDWRWIIGGIGAAILAVMAPAAIVAMVKLRKRDLAAILEGSGWAINAHMRLTLPQRRFFSKNPRFPSGSRGLQRWRFWVAIAIVVAVIAGAVVGTIKLRRMQAEKAAQIEADNAADEAADDEADKKDASPPQTNTPPSTQ